MFFTMNQLRRHMLFIPYGMMKDMRFLTIRCWAGCRTRTILRPWPTTCDCWRLPLLYVVQSLNLAIFAWFNRVAWLRIRRRESTCELSRLFPEFSERESRLLLSRKNPVFCRW